MKKGFITGVLIGIFCVFSTAFAADYIAEIQSADYNDSSVYFNGESLDLDGKKLISVTNEGEYFFTNYMPLRAVVEGLGYGVVWGYNEADGIGIFTEEFLSESDEWVNYPELLGILERISDQWSDYTSYFLYEEPAKAVRLAFGYPGARIVYFSTAVVGGDPDKIYISRDELNAYFANELGGVPPIEVITEEFLAGLDIFLGENVSVWDIGETAEVIGYWGDPEVLQGYLADGLLAAYNSASGMVEIYYGGELLGQLETKVFYPGWNAGLAYVDKAALNAYLAEIGLPEVE